jgi:hypothetical protein
MTRNITKEDQKSRLAAIESDIEWLQKCKEEVENIPLFEETLEGQIRELEKKALDQVQKICDKFNKETGRILQIPRLISAAECAEKMVNACTLDFNRLDYPKRSY